MLQLIRPSWKFVYLTVRCLRSYIKTRAPANTQVSLLMTVLSPLISVLSPLISVLSPLAYQRVIAAHREYCRKILSARGESVHCAVSARLKCSTLLDGTHWIHSPYGTELTHDGRKIILNCSIFTNINTFLHPVP